MRVVEGRLARLKGSAAVLADGVSAAEAGREAAEACVQGFLADYYCTPESWSVRTAAGRVITALNRWLYGQHSGGRGMASTLTVVIVKSRNAHVFHVGDSRAWRLRDGRLEQLTRDHTHDVGGRTYLARAMGMDHAIDIDHRIVDLQPGDVLALTTDGAHAPLGGAALARLLSGALHDPETTARAVVSHAHAAGGQDDATCQVLVIDEALTGEDEALYAELTALPVPPPLEPGNVIDGYRIVRELHASAHSQLYLALEPGSGQRVVLKTPSPNHADDAAWLEAFLHEEWVGRRVRNPHLVRALPPAAPRHFLYAVFEYVEGRTLRQWLHDHGPADLTTARMLLGQIAAGLQAMHRLEMVHRDLKPENVLIDAHGCVRLVDYGATQVAGLSEVTVPWARDAAIGTVGYLAPEVRNGYQATARSDVYSLGCIAHELLGGHLPHARSARSGGREAVQREPLPRVNPDVPAWVDAAIGKAMTRDPEQRHAEVAEFMHDLEHPNPVLLPGRPPPLIERSPTAVWRALAMLLALGNIALLYLLSRGS